MLHAASAPGVRLRQNVTWTLAGAGDQAPVTGTSEHDSPSLIAKGLSEVDCAGVLVAAMTSPEWMRRRVESVEFLQDSSINRRVSADVVVPDDLPAVGSGSSAVHLLPMALLEKRPLVSFDARDAAGSSIPVLSTSENGRISGVALCWIAETIPTKFTLHDDTKRRLYRLANDDPGSARQSLKALEASADGAEVRRRLGPWLERLADGFLLIAAIPVDSPVNQILKFCYEQRYEMEHQGDGIEAEDSRAAAARKKTLGRVGRVLGTRANSVELALPAAPMCHSFHFEATTPDDVDLPDARLLRRTTAGDSKIIPSRPATERYARRQHLFADVDASVEDPRVKLVLRPAASGWWLRCVLSSLLVALTLGVTWWRIDEAMESGPGSDLAALVVVIVGLASTALARPGAHELAVRLTPGIRVLALGSASLPYAAGLTIAFGAKSRCLDDLLGWLTVAAVAALAALAVPYLLVRNASEARR